MSTAEPETEDGSSQAIAALDGADDYVQRHPLTALVVAAIVGLVLSRWAFHSPAREEH